MDIKFKVTEDFYFNLVVNSALPEQAEVDFCNVNTGCRPNPVERRNALSTVKKAKKVWQFEVLPWAKESGIEILISHPTSQSRGKIFEKLGWVDMTHRRFKKKGKKYNFMHYYL